ncbi:hypothetical protein J7T55_014814 [Diaporthe amygdali]|uniref:uncharacterized protein n=1 Tax=Phomopsis amygdali TaxID=1214568 RepID=UPI0022FF3D0B|nr:uncharacterized protein J7T55_014814 [Diaporthe amygdali]KAJ0110012.1 hypothetical protein J7T55_014814 [Diaporthe amygdali]
MSWPPRVTVEDAVDETPWALLGEAPHGESHDPWQDHHNDVEPNSPTPFTSRPRPNFILYPAGPATPANPIPRRNFPPLYQTQAQAQAQAHAFHALNTGTSFLLSSPSSSSPAETLNQPEVPLSHRSRLARHQCLLAARRTMDYFNDGVEYVRGTYNATVDTTSAVYNAATSKTAQRTLLTTVLFAFLSSILFGFACVGYLAFYHEYLPDQVMTVPVHLQYGYELNPYGVASLSRANFKDYQDYDITVTLKLPNSPTNLGRGNFMLALYLLDDAQNPASKIMSTVTGAVPAPQSVLNDKNILFRSTRPAIMPYTDPLVSLAKRLLLLGYHVFIPASETTKLVVPMVERLEFRPGKMMPTSLVLDVQAGQSLQVYDVLVTVTAQLGGLRWFMHRWWITSFVLFTSLFWVLEVVSLASTAVAAKVLWSVCFGGGRGGAGARPGLIKEEQGRNPRIKQEGHSHGKALDDVPMTFPTSSQQPPLRYDPEPGHTDGVEGGVPPQQPQADIGGEADVEDEEAGDDYRGEDPQGRDSGIGTSFSERDGPGSMRRRTSQRRMSGN